MAAEERVRGFWGGGRSWLVPLGISLSIVLWGWFILATIGSQPRHWSYGAYPYVPGETAYATQRAAPAAKPARQIELPPPTMEPTQ